LQLDGFLQYPFRLGLAPLASFTWADGWRFLGQLGWLAWAPPILYGATAVWLMTVNAGGPAAASRPVAGLLTYGALSYFQFLGRTDLAHLIQAGPAFAVLLAVACESGILWLARFVSAVADTPSRRARSRDGLYAAGLGLLFLLGGSWIVHYESTVGSSYRAFDADGADPGDVAVSGGRLGLLRQPGPLASEIERVCSQVEARVPAGGTILAMPTAEVFYFLTRRTAPCRFAHTILGARRADQELLAASLDRAGCVIMAPTKAR
jgi:hypothetical protein